MREHTRGAEPPTPRQRRMLRMLAAGWSYPDIARELQLTETRVSQDVEEMKAYLGARHLVHALQLADDRGWL